MNREAFNDSVGEIYQVYLPHGALVEVILQEVGDLKPPPDDAPKLIQRQPFFLIFNGPLETPLPTGVLRLVGSEAQEYQLALNAEGYVDDDSAKGIRYCAIIN